MTPEPLRRAEWAVIASVLLCVGVAAYAFCALVLGWTWGA